MIKTTNFNSDDSEKSCECETPTVLAVNCLSFNNDQIVISVTVDKVILNSFIQVELLNSNNEIIQNYQNFVILDQVVQIININISNLINVDALNVRIKTQCSDGEYYCVRLKNDSDANSDQDSNSGDFFQLFDKISWENVVPQPYLNYLNQAADRWSQFIKYNDAYYLAIQSAVANNLNIIPQDWNESWNGLRLNSNSDLDIFNDPNSNTIASCGIVFSVNIDSSVKIQPLSFVLNINDFYKNQFTSEDWVNILTHELGHALGIGTLWQSSYQSQGAVPPIDNFLNGLFYSSGQVGYNNIINDSSYNKIPLESSGGTGTNSAHWENDFRSSSAPGADGKNYPGVQNELMVGFINPISNGGMIISQLSIQTLVDFGFEEVSPGSSEGVPNLNNAQSVNIQNSFKKLHCNCQQDHETIFLGTLPPIAKEHSFVKQDIDSDSSIDESCDTFCIPKSQYNPNIHELINIYNSLEECSSNCICDSDSCDDSCEDCVTACTANLEDPPWNLDDCVMKEIAADSYVISGDGKIPDPCDRPALNALIPKKLFLNIASCGNVVVQYDPGGGICEKREVTLPNLIEFNFSENKNLWEADVGGNEDWKATLSLPIVHKGLSSFKLFMPLFAQNQLSDGPAVWMDAYIPIRFRYRAFYSDYVFDSSFMQGSGSWVCSGCDCEIQPTLIRDLSFNYDTDYFFPFCDTDTSGCESPIDARNQLLDSIFINIYSDNTCRAPEPCPPEEICRNEIELDSLEKIPGPCDKCYCDGGGRPLDIDVHCDGEIRPATTYFPESTETFTLWFTPRGLGAVPVIENIIYDTTMLDEANDIVRIHTSSTAEEIREWVCKNLRFVTVKDYSKIKTDTNNAVESNWPYNDLYWAATCIGYSANYPNDIPINLVPC